MDLWDLLFIIIGMSRREKAVARLAIGIFSTFRLRKSKHDFFCP